MRPQGVDWDNDGKLDLIAGDMGGQVWFFKNIGTAKAPKLATGVQLKAGGKPILGVAPKFERRSNGYSYPVPNTNDLMGIYSKIHVGDWNGDGLKDLLVGQEGPGGSGQSLVLYLNRGTPREAALSTPIVIALPVGPNEPRLSRPSPYLTDWDGDGKPDLLCGTEGSEVYFFRNIGTRQAPKLANGVRLPLHADGFSTGYRYRIDVVDWNNDGKLDLLVGNFYSDRNPTGGNIWLFLSR